MSNLKRFIRHSALPQFLTLSLCATAAASTSDLQDSILVKLNELRAVKVVSGAENVETINRRLDEAWNFLIKHKNEALPLVATELKKELRENKPNDFFLLDAGYLLFLYGDSTDQPLSFQALQKVDYTSKIIQMNYKELFEFSHGFAASHDTQALALIDRAFLATEQQVYIPQHDLILPASLMCVFLYGVYGPESEDHLLRLLEQGNENTKTILEILTWIGTDKSVPFAKKALLVHPRHEIFIQAFTVLLSLGGPKGIAAVSDLDATKLDPKSRADYAKIKPRLKEFSFATLAERFDTFTGEKTLPPDTVKQRLAGMYENYGKDDLTNPAAILNADLSADYLITELVKIRSRMFYRISDEALHDVKTTNFIINALLFRQIWSTEGSPAKMN